MFAGWWGTKKLAWWIGVKDKKNKIKKGESFSEWPEVDYQSEGKAATAELQATVVAFTRFSGPVTRATDRRYWGIHIPHPRSPVLAP